MVITGSLLNWSKFMRIFWNNLVDKYDLIFSSEHSSYPVENLQDYQLAKKWHSTGDTDEWIKIDAGVGNTITATGAAILGHNLTSGATCKIQADADNVSWGAPTLDETFVYNADIMTEYFASTSLRYWRFHFADAANPDTYVSVGRLVLCEYLETPAGKDMTIGYGDTSVVAESLTGQSFGDEGIIQKSYSFDFPHWTDAVRKTIITMVEDIKLVKPIVLVADQSDQTKVIPVYCRLDDTLSLDHIIAYIFRGTLNFKEVF